MFYLLYKEIAITYPLYNLLRYITFRAALAACTAFFTCMLLGPFVIRKLQAMKIGQVVRKEHVGELHELHRSKVGTPTMGGALILVAVTFCVLLWGNLRNSYIWILLAVTLGFGLIGWVDDYRKLILKNSKGLLPRYKFLWQSIIGLGVAIVLYSMAKSPIETQLIVPFFKNVVIELGFVYIILAYFVIVCKIFPQTIDKVYKRCYNTVRSFRSLSQTQNINFRILMKEKEMLRWLFTFMREEAEMSRSSDCGRRKPGRM